MELFVKVMFWIHVAALLIGALQLTFGEYPRKRGEVHASHDLVGFMVGACFVVWAWWLVWGPGAG